MCGVPVRCVRVGGHREHRHVRASPQIARYVRGQHAPLAHRASVIEVRRAGIRVEVTDIRRLQAHATFGLPPVDVIATVAEHIELEARHRPVVGIARRVEDRAHRKAAIADSRAVDRCVRGRRQRNAESTRLKGQQKGGVDEADGDQPVRLEHRIVVHI